jgi:heat shock protein HtpX
VVEPPNLFAQQETNRRRSRWLVASFIIFFAWLGLGGDWLLYEATRQSAAGHYHHIFPWFTIGLGALGAGIVWWAWTNGPDAVLWSTGARELTSPTTPAEKQLDNVVQEMAVAAGIPKPRIYLIDDADPNAFATGHDPASARIAVTTALLTLCSRDELQAVVAHEMGHVRNLDVRLMTLLAGLVGVIALMSQGMGRMLFQGGGRVSLGRNKDSKNLGPVFFLVLVLWVVSWILAPIVAQVLAMGVSRDREYLADAMSAQFTRNPLALASALQKIDASDAPSSVIKSGAAHLCIADPLGRTASMHEGWLADRLGTHPPMPIRIARLKAMGYQELKAQGNFTPAPTS